MIAPEPRPPSPARTASTCAGNGLDNTVVGGSCADTLNGGVGNDRLDGQAGADRFDFTTTLSEMGNVDKIQSFAVADDLIRIDDAVFSGGGLALGTLAASQFVIAAAAMDASDRAWSTTRRAVPFTTTPTARASIRRSSSPRSAPDLRWRTAISP